MRVSPAVDQAPPTRRLVVLGGWACLALSVGLFAFGAATTGILGQSSFSPTGVARLSAVSGIYWLLLLAAVRGFGLQHAGAIVTALLVGVAAAAQFGATAAVLYTLASVWSLGDLLFGRAFGGRRDAVHTVALTATGLAILGAMLGIAALVPLASPGSYFVLLALPLLLNRRRLAQVLRGIRLAQEPGATLVEAALLALLGNAVLLVLLTVLLPEIGNDALSHHLALLAYLRDFGMWHFDITKTLLAVMPLGGNFAFAAPYVLGGEFGARLANFSCYAMLLAMVHGWVRMAAPRWIALLVTTCVATMPIVLLATTSLFIENPWALFLVASIALVARAAGAPAGPGSVYAAAVLFGAAIATKTMAVAAAPVLIIAAASALGGSGRWRRLLAALGLGLAVALPPYVIAFVKTGNPVFPFLNSYFKSPLFLPQEIGTWAGTLDPRALYHATFSTFNYLESGAGAIGFVPLLLIPLSLFIGFVAGPTRERVLIAAAVCFTVIVFGKVGYLRYIYPAFFLMAMAAGHAIGVLRRSDSALYPAVVGAAVLGGLASLPHAASAWVPGRDFPLQPVFDRQAGSEYLRVWAPQRALVARINLEPPAAGNVAFLGVPAITGLQRRGYVRSLLDWTFHATLTRDPSVANVAKELAGRDIGLVMVDGATPVPLQHAIAQLGTLVSEHGAARLYRIDDSPVLQREVLRDGTPSNAALGWGFHGTPAVEPTTGDVTVTSTAYVGARVPVTPESRYRIHVGARCGSPTGTLRLQVLWTDAAGAALGVSVTDRHCRADWHDESVVLRSPPDAAFASVYILASDAEAVVVRRAAMQGR